MSAESQSLPHIDEHSIEIMAGPQAVWDALGHVVERTMSSRGAPQLGRLLGSADLHPGGPRPLTEGSSITGFHVDVAEAPHELALVGTHRFSRYALIFRLHDLGEGRTRLRAETRADFPGFKGSIYKTFVIRTRGHVLATRRVLTATKRRAER